MAVKTIRCSNFKTFADLAVELGAFNVIVGSNAAGKSNFVNILRFLRDTLTFDIDNAISLQGGPKYLRNMNIGSSRPLSIDLTTDRTDSVYLPLRDPKTTRILLLRTSELRHKLVLKFKKGLDYDVAESLVEMSGTMSDMDLLNHNSKTNEPGPGHLRCQMLYGDLTFSAKVPPESGIDAAALFLPQLPRSAINRSKKSLVYEHMPIVSTTAESFREFAIFDFDPKLPKRAVQITGKAELEEDGSNLALILKRVTEDPEKNRMFSNLVSDLLPFVENIGVEKFSDKSMLFKVREKYCSRDFVPASMVSDGTITVALLVLALFFVSKPTIVIEEPERNLHPALIGPLVSMMKDASKTRQIIVTTHNPLLVKHAGIENLLLVSRDQKGFSVIVRPRDKQEVRTFLENEIGIDELFTQNLLEL